MASIEKKFAVVDERLYDDQFIDVFDSAEEAWNHLTRSERVPAAGIGVGQRIQPGINAPAFLLEKCGCSTDTQINPPHPFLPHSWGRNDS